MTQFLLFFGCSESKKNGVYFEELPSAPLIEITDRNIKVKVENSIKNSAKSICKITYDKNGEKVFLKAFQKLSNLPFTKYQNEIYIRKEKILADNENIDEVMFIWVDPDGKEIPIE